MISQSFTTLSAHTLMTQSALTISTQINNYVFNCRVHGYKNPLSLDFVNGNSAIFVEYCWNVVMRIGIFPEYVSVVVPCVRAGGC